MPHTGPWDLFCRVIDNHGDLGVCWRLARGLAAGGTAVRLWVDDPSALAWMAPQGAAGVTVRPWAVGEPTHERPGPVVVEAFGCDPPADFVGRMAALAAPPLWINLEYLSAEAYVARSHRLPSPQASGPGKGLTKWFFYPGFTAATGGLMHGDGAEAGPASEAASDQHVAHPDAAAVLVFAYATLPWPGLLQGLSHWLGKVQLGLPPGPAAHALALHQQRQGLPAGCQWHTLPLRPQPAFDALLRSQALAVVRGEDSFARANLVCDGPFLWHIYPQDDGAHVAKLEAFLQCYLRAADAGLAQAVASVFRAVNGLAPWPARWPDRQAWQAHQRAWRQQLRQQADLIAQLRAFVTEKGGPGAAGTAIKAQ